MRFDVKYTFEFLSKEEPKGYTVNVLSNVTDKNNFEFTVDGQIYVFSGETDWTDVFDIKKHDTYFTINIHDSVYLKDLLQLKYPAAKIDAPKVRFTEGYFTLAVSSYNEGVTVYLDIFSYIPVESIELIGGDVLL